MEGPGSQKIKHRGQALEHCKTVQGVGVWLTSQLMAIQWPFDLGDPVDRVSLICRIERWPGTRLRRDEESDQTGLSSLHLCS